MNQKTTYSLLQVTTVEKVTLLLPQQQKHFPTSLRHQWLSFFMLIEFHVLLQASFFLKINLNLLSKKQEKGEKIGKEVATWNSTKKDNYIYSKPVIFFSVTRQGKWGHNSLQIIEDDR